MAASKATAIGVSANTRGGSSKRVDCPCEVELYESLKHTSRAALLRVCCLFMGELAHSVVGAENARIVDDLVLELKAWLRSPDLPDRVDQARADRLGSHRLYWEFAPRLNSALSSKEHASDFGKLGLVMEFLLFVVSELDAAEAVACPSKPNLLPSDVVEVGWDDFVAAIDEIATLSENPELYREAVVRLGKWLETAYPWLDSGLGRLPDERDFELGWQTARAQ